ATISIVFIINISFLFLNDPATPEIYTLSLHDALPIYATNGMLKAMGLTFEWKRHHRSSAALPSKCAYGLVRFPQTLTSWRYVQRSEEHTSELQSRGHLVCRLLLEKKNK